MEIDWTTTEVSETITPRNAQYTGLRSQVKHATKWPSCCYSIIKYCEHLQALSSNALSAVPDITLEEATSSALQTLYKRLGNNIRTNRQGVCVIASNKIGISLRLAQRLPRISSISTVVNIESVGAECSSDALAVVDKAATAVSESTSLPGVVGSRAADDDLGALCDECLACLDQVEGVGVHGSSGSVVR